MYIHKKCYTKYMFISWLQELKYALSNDMAQLPVVHAQNILQDRARDLCHFRSRD
jgi:hypothetical protein